MSEDEIKELTPIVGKEIKILRKGVRETESNDTRGLHSPIRFIYAGDLYCNRYKSLLKVAEGIRKANEDGVIAELHIYTGTRLTGKTAILLNDGCSTFSHGLVEPSTLARLYQESDVAIHCESFDLKYKLMTRLSFSTKVIDCFQSGCAILAIAWEEHSALKYLKKENAAICVSSFKDIGPTVRTIIENPNLITEYAQRAYECEKKNHRIEDVQKTLYESLVRCSQ
jgi:hypothetical protein